MMLQYNSDQKRLISKFKEYRNDIDIYTEDEQKDKEFYSRLFRKLIEGTDVTINDIFPLGCSKNVVKHCKADINSGERKKLYIVDGDIYLLYKPKRIIPNLFILDSYCIENYVIEKQSIENLAYELNGTMSLEDIQSAIKFDVRLREIMSPLIKLFINISIESEITDYHHIYHIKQFLSKDQLDNKKIETQIEIIKNKVLAHIDNDHYENLLQERLKIWEINEINLLKIISGKDYLIPFFIEVIKNINNLNLSIPKESIKFQLLKYCSLERLADLKNAIMTPYSA